MTTIKDVAQLAQVSPSTVSRVIANNQRISPATHRRVRQAMVDLNYHPNMIARSLVKRSSSTIALVLSRSTASAFANPFFPEIIRGISSVTQEKHYNLILTAANDFQQEAEEALRLLFEKTADGILLLAPRVNDELISKLTAAAFPFVVVGRVPSGNNIYTVNNDNVLAAYKAACHLLNLGHRRIAFINGPIEYTVCQDRLLGYQQALREFKVEPDPLLIANIAFSQDESCQRVQELLKLPQRPSAIVAVDDLMAFGAYQAIKAAGLKIPADIAVTGFNDDPLATLIEPGLTTVRIPIYDMGVTATELLIKILQGKTPPSYQVVLDSELIIRTSV